MENVEKEKEAPNQSISCPKVNGGQSEPEAVLTKKVWNDQSESIVKMLTEHVTEEGTDENERRKHVNILPGR